MQKTTRDIEYFRQMKPIVKALIDLFFPETCAGCDTLLVSGELAICTKCRHEIPLTGHHQVPQNDAWQKFYGRLPIEHASALCYFHKRGIVQRMIHKLKYQGNEEIGQIFGSWYGAILSETIKTTDSVIIPVPLHKRRLRERGYNQVAAFGKALAEALQIPYEDNFLLRNRYSKTQTKKKLLARVLKDNEMFSVNLEIIPRNRHFIIVDDVITTGATLEACGKAVLKVPGSTISIVCIAMSHS